MAAVVRRYALHPAMRLLPRPAPLLQASFSSTSPALKKKKKQPVKRRPLPKPVVLSVPPSITHEPLHPFLRTQTFRDAQNEQWIKLGLAPTADPEAVKAEGRRVLRAVLERWAREDLNVRASIQEDTMQIFLDNMMHPLTLSHFAHMLRLLPMASEDSLPHRPSIPLALSPPDGSPPSTNIFVPSTAEAPTDEAAIRTAEERIADVEEEAIAASSADQTERTAVEKEDEEEDQVSESTVDEKDGFITPAESSIQGPVVRLKPSDTTLKTSRTVPKHDDIILTDVILSYLGGLSLDLGSPDPLLPPPELTCLILPFYRKSGPPQLRYPCLNGTLHEEIFKYSPPHSAAVLLLRAGIQSQQTRPRRPPTLDDNHLFKVAQLGIYGPRRERELRKLVPNQSDQWTEEGIRKAEVLKSRWYEEEIALIPWRARMQKVTNARAADLDARAKYRAKAHLQRRQAETKAAADEGKEALDAERSAGGIPSVAVGA